MAVVEDVIRHRLEIAGLAGYTHHIHQAAGALNVLEHHLDAAGKRQFALGIGAGAAALAIVEGLHHAAEAAGEEEAAFKRATIGFHAHGRSFPEEELEKFAAAQEHLTGVSREQIAASAGLLGVYGATKSQVESLVPGILDIAAAMKDAGVSTESATRMVGMFLETGRQGRLQRLGIIIRPDEVASLGRAGALAAAMKRAAGGAAAEMRDTLPGATMAAANAFHDLEVSVGKGFVPIMRVGTEVLGGAASALEKIPGAGTAIAIVMTLAAVRLGIFAFQTLKTVKALIELAEAHVAAANAATKHAAAEQNLGNQLGKVGGAARRSGLGAGIQGGIIAGGTNALLGGSGAGEDVSAQGKLSRIGTSAAEGALMGSRGGLIGTAGGAVVGAIIAGIREIAVHGVGTDYSKKPGETEAVKEAKKQTALLQEQTNHLKDIRSGISDAVGSKELEKALGAGRIAREYARSVA